MTEAIPEPTNVGPIAGGYLRASDADRDQVAALLCSAYAEGRLTREEHDERIDHLIGAKSFDDLIAITRDLVVIGTPSAVAAALATSRIGPDSDADASPILERCPCRASPIAAFPRSSRRARSMSYAKSAWSSRSAEICSCADKVNDRSTLAAMAC